MGELISKEESCVRVCDACWELEFVSVIIVCCERSWKIESMADSGADVTDTVCM